MPGLEENDTVSTFGDDGRRLRLYPKWIRGRLLTARTTAHAVLLLLLLTGPWIDIAGHPAIRFDIPGRRAYLWGATLFATDGAYLLFFFGAVIFSVFFFTAVFGRAWCGWTCPQTVFLETLIRPIERLIEGSSSKRRKLDAAPWSASKLAKKATKYAAFLVVAGGIATTFTAYFLGREGVMEAQVDPSSHPVGTGVFIFLTGVLMFDFAWFREQTCIVVCPYGRFQSVLLDANSLGVVYDEKRGEPRGKKSDPNAGDCVDCKQCLQVCPTGIDIRKGGQMECVQCMACVDACNGIMGKLGRDPGLIRLASENSVAGKPTRFLRPRVIAYGTGLVGVAIALAFTLSGRDPIELNVSRQPTAPYVTLPDGRQQNGLRLRISNKSKEPRTFTMKLSAPPDGELVTPLPKVRVAPNKVEHVPVFVLQDGDKPEGRTFTITVSDDNGWSDEVSIDFIGKEQG